MRVSCPKAQISLKKQLFFKLINLNLSFNFKKFETKTGQFYAAQAQNVSFYFINYHFFWQNFKSVEFILGQNFILSNPLPIVFVSVNTDLCAIRNIALSARRCFEYWVNTPQGLSNLTNKSLKFWGNSMLTKKFIKSLSDFLPYKTPGIALFLDTKSPYIIKQGTFESIITAGFLGPDSPSTNPHWFNYVLPAIGSDMQNALFFAKYFSNIIYQLKREAIYLK